MQTARWDFQALRAPSTPRGVPRGVAEASRELSAEPLRRRSLQRAAQPRVKRSRVRGGRGITYGRENAPVLSVVQSGDCDLGCAEDVSRQGAWRDAEENEDATALKPLLPGSPETTQTRTTEPSYTKYRKHSD